MKPKIAYSYLNFVSKTVAQTRTSKRLIESAKKWCANQNLVLKPCVFETQGLGTKGSAKGLRNFLQEIRDRKIQPGSVLILEDLPDYQTAPPHQTYRDMVEIISHGVDVVTLADSKRHDKKSLQDPIGLIWSLAISWHLGETSNMRSQRAKAVVSFHRSKPKAATPFPPAAGATGGRHEA
jgi:hypothetical protein